MEWRNAIEGNKNIDLWQDNVNELIIENNVISGVKTLFGNEFRAKSVILTTGTFGNGLIHIGRVHHAGGRISEPNIDRNNRTTKGIWISLMEE